MRKLQTLPLTLSLLDPQPDHPGYPESTARDHVTSASTVLVDMGHQSKEVHGSLIEGVGDNRISLPISILHPVERANLKAKPPTNSRTIEEAAERIAVAYVEGRLGMQVALRTAISRNDSIGFDFWIGPRQKQAKNRDSIDFGTMRLTTGLEVSGTTRTSYLNSRIKQKKQQVSPSKKLTDRILVVVVNFSDPAVHVIEAT